MYVHIDKPILSHPILSMTHRHVGLFSPPLLPTLSFNAYYYSIGRAFTAHENDLQPTPAAPKILRKGPPAVRCDNADEKNATRLPAVRGCPLLEINEVTDLLAPLPCVVSSY
jgi:hypothetical protein